MHLIYLHREDKLHKIFSIKEISFLFFTIEPIDDVLNRRSTPRRTSTIFLYERHKYFYERNI